LGLIDGFGIYRGASRKQIPISNTVSLASIQVDGTGFGYLLGAPATWPSFRPTVVHPTVPRLQVNAKNTGGQLVFSWPAAGDTSVLERSAQLGGQGKLVGRAR